MYGKVCGRNEATAFMNAVLANAVSPFWMAVQISDEHERETSTDPLNEWVKLKLSTATMDGS